MSMSERPSTTHSGREPTTGRHEPGVHVIRQPVSRGAPVAPDFLSVLANPHILRRSEGLREPEEEALTALGLCGE
jgi:hypothetical protein